MTQKAMRCLQIAEANEPDYAMTPVYWAEIRESEGRFDEAETLFRKAVRMSGHHHETVWQLALFLERMGRVEEMCELLDGWPDSVPQGSPALMD